MSQDVRVTNFPPADCKERVPLDLMGRITGYEPDIKPKDRAYWLKLYSQCLQVVSGVAHQHVS